MRRALAILIPLAALAFLFDSPWTFAEKRSLKIEGKAPAEFVASQGGKAWAVVIGIDEYELMPRLSYAVADAQAVARLLERQGFQVTELYNKEAHRRGILQELGEKLVERTEAHDRVLIFFAGHGETKKAKGEGKEMGYLMPVNVRPGSLTDSAISMGLIQELADGLPAKHVLFLVDACYAGIAGRRSRGVPAKASEDYFKVITRERGRQLITAGGGDQEALEGPEWGHSVFTYYLLEGLGKGLADMNDDGIIPASELHYYLDQRVFDAAQMKKHKQRPEMWVLAPEKGEFVFVRDKPAGSSRASAVSSAKDPQTEQQRLQAEQDALEREKQLAEERAKLEAERRQVAEEKARQKAEREKMERALREAEERAKLEAERRQKEEERRRATEEKARNEQEERKREEAKQELKALEERQQQIEEQQKLTAMFRKQMEEMRQRTEPKQPAPIEEARVRPPSAPGQTGREITGKAGAPMVLVPAGEFLYGDNNQRLSLPAFYMDKYEMTTSRYAKFLQETARKQPFYWNQVSLASLGDRPVVGVDWHDAEAYCRFYGKRLPTEQEWEKAARGTDGRKYPWGNEEPSRSIASYNWDSERNWQGYSTLASVESYESGKSPYGIYNMAGNVWEWTSSNYDGERKALRGGSWTNYALDLRSTLRDWVTPTYRYYTLGFRCAQDVS